MTEHDPIPLADAIEAGYTLSPAEFAEQTTLQPQRIKRAIRGANGPGLGMECPILPAAFVRLSGSPPGYRLRPEEAEDWLRQVWVPWPPPADPIDSPQTIALLNRGVPLRATTREYKAVLARLGRSGVRTWRLLGKDRYSRAEVEQLAALWTARGITTDRIPMRDKGRHSLPPGDWLNTHQAGEKLARLRKSREPLDDATIARLAPEIPGALKQGRRWWFAEKPFEDFVELLASTGAVIREPKRDAQGNTIGRGGGKVIIGCRAARCSEVVERPWSTLYEIRDGEIVKQNVFVYCSVEHYLDSRDQWFKARGARIMVPCICVLEGGGPCGRLTRVRTGREHQAETGWAPPCPECKRAGRVLPKGQKRSPAGRANMTVGRRAFFARPRTQRAQELVDEYAERAPDMREAVLAFNADVSDDMRRKRVVPTTKAVKLLGWPAQHVRSSSVLTVVRFQFGQAVRLGVPAREVATTAGDPAVFGRLSRELADGPVGRPPMKRPDGSRLSTEELAEVERLLLTAAGWSQQRIANRFRVSRDQVKRYAAALKRLGETPLSAA